MWLALQATFNCSLLVIGRLLGIVGGGEKGKLTTRLKKLM